MPVPSSTRSTRPTSPPGDGHDPATRPGRARSSAPGPSGCNSLGRQSAARRPRSVSASFDRRDALEPDDPAAVVLAARVDDVSVRRPRRPRSVSSVAPTSNRSAPKSVSGATTTWPLMPCGRTIRPTVTIESSRTRQSTRRGNRPSTLRPSSSPAAAASVRTRGGRAALPADHAAELARRHRQLDDGLAAPLGLGDAHLVRPAPPAPARRPRRRRARGSRRGLRLRPPAAARRHAIDQRPHGVGRLRARLQPVREPIAIDRPASRASCAGCSARAPRRTVRRAPTCVSVTTTRKNGRFFDPARRILIANMSVTSHSTFCIRTCARVGPGLRHQDPTPTHLSVIEIPCSTSPSTAACPCGRRRGAAHRLEHLAHLDELLQHAVDLFDPGAAAARDALAAAAVDERVVAALARASSS